MRIGTGVAADWARSEYRYVDLGDSRRTARLMLLAARAAQSPAGMVSKVFTTDAERQGAYDFLESKHIEAKSMVQGLGKACAQSCAALPFAFVAVDGSGATVVDHKAGKGLGSVGHSASAHHARGVKVVTALALDPCGVPVGMAWQEFWSRPARPKRTRREQKRESRHRPESEKETRHWNEVIEQAASQFDAAHANAWFVIDREGDSRTILESLLASGHHFTVRSCWDHSLENVDGSPVKLRAAVKNQPVLAEYNLDIPATSKRTARRAHMQTRASEVTLKLRIADTRYVQHVTLTVVWAHETGTTPKGEEPVDWMLLTSYPVRTVDDARLVLYGYTQRWRIEDTHKAWKSAACGVEQTQLRSHCAIVRWATLLFTVAIRAERLKHLSRQQPTLPATAALSTYEIRALLLLKRRERKRTESVPNSTPSLAQATRWIADLGGYTGKSSGGPPGLITIGRGLLRVQAAASALQELESTPP